MQSYFSEHDTVVGSYMSVSSLTLFTCKQETNQPPTGGRVCLMTNLQSLQTVCVCACVCGSNPRGCNLIRVNAAQIVCRVAVAWSPW